MLLLKDRMKHIRKELGISQREVAETLGCKVGKIKQIESGSTASLSFADSKLLEKKYRINDSWIRTGLGDVFIELSLEDMALLENDFLEPNNLSIPFFKNIEDLENSSIKKSKHKSCIFIPEELITQEESLVAILVDSDYMNPTFTKNDLLLLDNTKIDFEDGKIFLIKYDQANYIRRLFKMPNNKVILKSDNVTFPDIEIDIKDCNIIARVVYSINFKNLN